jgi:hypothetical protein
MLVIGKFHGVVNPIKEVYHVEFDTIFREDGENCWAVGERFNSVKSGTHCVGGCY